MTRLFVAVWPGDEVVSALVDLDLQPESGVRLVPPENWHITLRFLGDADPDEVIARLAAATLPAATATLGPTVERLGARALVVPVDGVDGLAEAVRQATADVGAPVGRDFRGHLTVARTKPDATSTAIGTPFSAEFVVRDVAVVESRLSNRGATYTTRARFATGAT